MQVPILKGTAAVQILTPHPRLLFGAALGFATAGVLWTLGAPPAIAGLIGWNVGAVGYLIMIWRLYLTADEHEVRARAARQDEPAVVIFLLAGLSIIASLAAVVFALQRPAGAPDVWRAASPGLAALTLVTSWFVVHSLFVAHYAHRHYQAIAARGDKAGFLFPGDPPGGYLDFAYLAICIGATAQVSDPGVQSRPLRNLVTAHAVTAFFYNTAVLALGVNILSGLLGH
jgi:uncharacterized membrane protein